MSGVAHRVARIRSLLVLGAEPGAAGHPVPGSAVGFMPQEIALYQELTIGEVMRFHSRLHDMSAAEYQQRLVRARPRLLCVLVCGQEGGRRVC